MSSLTVTIRMSDQKLVRSYMIAYVIIANNAQYLQSQVLITKASNKNTPSYRQTHGSTCKARAI